MRFVINLKPIAKQSFRAKHNNFGYTPKQVVDFTREFRKQIIAQLAGSKRPIFGKIPLHVCIRFVFATENKRKFLDWKITRPDLDNLTKAIYDAMKNVVYQDDSCICHDEHIKCYERKERIVIMVNEIDEPKAPEHWPFKSNEVRGLI